MKDESENIDQLDEQDATLEDKNPLGLDSESLREVASIVTDTFSANLTEITDDPNNPKAPDTPAVDKSSEELER